ncbi:Hypothetical protein Minf_2002 [Methylacidiphilum infernorum V4]|uniref:Uncharacterized protein n=1 Tax=Methylacidiphilum infernorum (isolate V4) TaxID=481448 RepID=B3DYK8_METI4|nr:Hypothetical protein Minf_2002 [Methylacidiphilum infernorum V4]
MIYFGLIDNRIQRKSVLKTPSFSCKQDWPILSLRTTPRADGESEGI